MGRFTPVLPWGKVNLPLFTLLYTPTHFTLQNGVKTEQTARCGRVQNQKGAALHCSGSRIFSWTLLAAHSCVQHKHSGKLGRRTKKRQKASIGRGYKHGGVCGFRICGSEFENRSWMPVAQMACIDYQ